MLIQIEQKTLREVFEAKLKMAKRAAMSWPRFLKHHKDMALCAIRWKERYKNQRIIMWDNTNVNFTGKPTDADLQRMTYSLYYGGNVAKGGVFLQLSGWLGGWDLWLGAVSDTDYFEQAGILEAQEAFQRHVDVDDNVIPFTNIMDKGYRSILAAWRAGDQLLLQPFFAKSDRKFTSKEVLLSAAVATDRSGNERAVRAMKRSGFIRRGIHQKQKLDQFADFWLAWGFQVNFMYKPVL